MKISVALCTYNGEKFIREQLESILNQSLKVDEIIISDDVSTDSTENIIREYERTYPDVIKFFNNRKRIGTIKNFERAISYTTGELIFLSDQDDIWISTKVLETFKFFKKNSNCKLLFTNAQIIDSKGKNVGVSLWQKWDFNKSLQRSWANNNYAFGSLIKNDNKITGATICFHQSLKDNILPITIPYGYWHDAWIGLHAAALDGLYYLDNELLFYRSHNAQQVGFSKGVSDKINLNANSTHISKNLFHRKIRKMYPNKSHLIPKENNKFESLLRYCKNWLQRCKSKS